VLEQNGLAGTRRGDDETALALANGRQQIHDARRQRFGAGLQKDPFMGIDGREIVKVAARVFIDFFAFDVLDVGQARAAASLGGLGRPADH
jgi:hypothetical protein